MLREISLEFAVFADDRQFVLIAEYGCINEPGKEMWSSLDERKADLLSKFPRVLIVGQQGALKLDSKGKRRDFSFPEPFLVPQRKFEIIQIASMYRKATFAMFSPEP